MKYIYALFLVLITTISTAQDIDSYEFIIAELDERKLSGKNIIIDNENNIYVIGDTRPDELPSPDWRFFVTKYLPNADIDTSFGVDGFFTYNFEEGTASASDLLVLPNGKIMVIGNIRFVDNTDVLSKIFIARLNPEGTFDTDFNTVGYTILDDYYNSDSNKMIMTSENKILIAGGISTEEEQSNLAFIKLNLDGSYDTTFGTDGIQLIDTSSYYYQGDNDLFSTIEDFTIQADGSMMAVATTGNNYLVAKFTPELILDTTFGNGEGLFEYNSSMQGYSDGYNYRPRNLFVNDDGTMYIFYIRNCDFTTCNAGDASNSHLQIAKIHQDGTLDTSFAEDGIFYNGKIYGGAEVHITADQEITIAYVIPHNFRLKKIDSQGNLVSTLSGSSVWISANHSLTARELRPTSIIAHPVDDEIMIIGWRSGAEFGQLLIFGNLSLISILGVDDVVSTDQVKAYPNPSKDRFFLEGTFSNNTKVQVIDALGKVVFEKNITAFDKQIDLNEQPKGIYFIKIEGQTTSLKVIKN